MRREAGQQGGQEGTSYGNTRRLGDSRFRCVRGSPLQQFRHMRNVVAYKFELVHRQVDSRVRFFSILSCDSWALTDTLEM
jgi:hypothetical protein